MVHLHQVGKVLVLTAASLAAGFWLPRPWRVGQVIVGALDLARRVIAGGWVVHGHRLLRVVG